MCRDAFCLFYDAKEKTVKALNGSGHSPAKLSIDYVRTQGVFGNKIPASNLNSVTVPGMIIKLIMKMILDDNPRDTTGAAAAWVDTVEKFGSGNVSLADVLAPAIRLAEEGYVVLCKRMLSY